MRRLTIDVSDVSFQRLRDLAQAERRHPRDQAALLVEKAIHRALPPDRLVGGSGRVGRGGSPARAALAEPA